VAKKTTKIKVRKATKTKRSPAAKAGKLTKKTAKRTATSKTAGKKAASKKTASKKKTTKARKTTRMSTAKKTVKKKAARKATTKKAAKKATAKRTAKTATKRAATKGKRRRRNPLTKQEIEHFRQLLLEKRAELIGDVSLIESEALKKSRLDAAGDLSSMPIHMADIGTDNFEQEFALGLMSSERKILTEIEAALQRIQEGCYGICEGTGKPIEKKRLEAIPWARYSMEYAQMVEKGLVEEGERIGGYQGWEAELLDDDESDELDEVDPFEFLKGDDEDEDDDY